MLFLKKYFINKTKNWDFYLKQYKINSYSKDEINIIIILLLAH
jgi:hypothetical protein